MAIHCGVCGTRILSAAENGGSFPVGDDFTGPETKINDTCESCERELRAVITVAANSIVQRNRQSVEKRRAENASRLAAEEAAKQRRTAFEQEWAQRERSIK